MKSAIVVVVAAAVLAAATAGVGWLGVRDWDGESGGHVLLALPGLPLWACTIALAGLGAPLAVALSVGGVAQFLCCLVLVAGVRAAVRVVRPSPREY